MDKTSTPHDANNNIDIPNPRGRNRVKQHQSKTSPIFKAPLLQQHGYKLIKQIGEGSYSKVMLADSIDQNPNQVAIKILMKTKLPSMYLKKFLPREMEITQGLNHVNIIRFYETVETTHRVYFIMEYAEKGSLLDIIRAEHFLDRNRARKYFTQLVAAVDYCHGQGIVHRDIKSENILFDKNDVLKLVDFGFARERMQPIGRIYPLSETYCGSFSHASPEILQGKPYNPQQSDIWAMGVVLFAMVYGKLPFKGRTLPELMKEIRNPLVFPNEPIVDIGCKNLISHILVPVKDRLSIAQIKNHPWLVLSATKSRISANKFKSTSSKGV